MTSKFILEKSCAPEKRGRGDKKLSVEIESHVWLNIMEFITLNLKKKIKEGEKHDF